MRAFEEPREPYLINTYLYATAQHIIYAGTPAIYYYYKTRIELRNIFKWDEWKE